MGKDRGDGSGVRLSRGRRGSLGGVYAMQGGCVRAGAARFRMVQGIGRWGAGGLGFGRCGCWGRRRDWWRGLGRSAAAVAAAAGVGAGAAGAFGGSDDERGGLARRFAPTGADGGGGGVGIIDIRRCAEALERRNGLGQMLEREHLGAEEEEVGERAEQGADVVEAGPVGELLDGDAATGAEGGEVGFLGIENVVDELGVERAIDDGSRRARRFRDIETGHLGPPIGDWHGGI